MVTADNENWLLHFEARLDDITSPPVYWISSLLLILGLVSLLWSAPTPEEFKKISPLLNWGSALLMVTAVYYFIISLPLAIGTLPVLLGIAAFEIWLAGSAVPALPVSGAALVIAVCGLYFARRSVAAALQDLQFVMLAPAYLLSLVYRRFGIPI